jgi:hypothetical protein
MASYPKVVLQVAAMTGIAVMLSMAVPAVAAEGPIALRESASAANTVPSKIKRHASRRSHIAASRYDRRVSSMRSDLGCSGVWCGRQFVLMIGIGF